MCNLFRRVKFLRMHHGDFRIVITKNSKPGQTSCCDNCISILLPTSMNYCRNTAKKIQYNIFLFIFRNGIGRWLTRQLCNAACNWKQLSDRGSNENVYHRKFFNCLYNIKLFQEKVNLKYFLI